MVQEELGKPIPKVQAGHVIAHHQGAPILSDAAPLLGLASVHAQELLDYLKQFDKDGKGGLSKEELQEVMRGRMRCVLGFHAARIPGRNSHRKRGQHK